MAARKKLGNMNADPFDIDVPVRRCGHCGGPQESATAEKCRYCDVALSAVSRSTGAEPPWTHFWDMHSGGGIKVDPYEHIYIQAPEAEACVVFYMRFHRSPHRVTCTCCGADYSVSESETLAQASGHQRGLRLVSRKRLPGVAPSAPCNGDERYLEPGEAVPDGFQVSERYGRKGDGISLREYMLHKDVKIIPASEIAPHERNGELPVEGYVWHDGEEEDS